MDNEEKEFAKKIRDEYSAKENEVTKIEELKALENKVKVPTNIFAFTFGIFSALILGTGMCFAMNVFKLSQALAFGIGIPVGIIGIALCILTPFIYKKMLASKKKKYGEKIVSISNEILNEDKNAD